MKIILTKDSLIYLPKDIKKIDLNNGFSVGNIDTVEKISWFKKVLEKINLNIYYNNSISEDTQLSIDYFAKAVNYLQKDKGLEKNHLNHSGFSFKIDNESKTETDSKFNNLLKLVLPKSKKNTYIVMGEHENKNYSSLNANSISVEGYFDKKTVPFWHDLKEKIGVEDAASFKIFKEASYHYRTINTDIYNTDKSDSSFVNIILISDILGTSKKKLEENNPILASKVSKINTKLFGIEELDKIYFKSISQLSEEMYTDISAVFLQRNKDITEGKHSKEKDLKIIDAVISTRKEVQKDLMKWCLVRVNKSAPFTSPIFSSFTSPGLEKIKEMYDSNEIENKILSQEEIYKIAKKGVEQGLSRVLLGNMKSNSENEGKLQLLSSLVILNKRNHGADIDLDTKEINDDEYREFIKNLSDYAGIEWVKKLDNISDEVKRKGISGILKEIAIWNGVFHENLYEIDNVKKIEKNEVIKDVMGEENKSDIKSLTIKDIAKSIKNCRNELINDSISVENSISKKTI